MAEAQFIQLDGINTYLSPLANQDGNTIHCLNLKADPIGGLTKRNGYVAYLGTPDNGTVNSLFSWTKNDGTTLFTYRASGSALYYSIQGTGNWTLCGNGTIGNGAHVAYAIQDNTLMIADGVGSTRHTTNGTAFTNTTLAPVAVDLVPYQGRMYALGTASNLFYSTSGTVTDWTTDSSSLFIPGGGKLLKGFVASDRLLITKNSNLMFRWDGDSLTDMGTRLGPSSPYSFGEVEDFRFWINRLGVFTSNAGKPQLVSNPVQNLFYNKDDTGMNGMLFDSAAGGDHRYDYYVSLGTVTDSLVGERIPNAILDYDYKHNDFVTARFAHFPTAYHSFKDRNGVDQFIFGDGSGQCYMLDSSVNTDNGFPIESNYQLVVHANAPFMTKEWGYIEVFTNPGCEASIQIACEETMIVNEKRWFELGHLISGFNQFRIPTEYGRSKLMFIRIYDSGSSDEFSLYGINVTYNLVPR